MLENLSDIMMGSVPDVTDLGSVMTRVSEIMMGAGHIVVSYRHLVTEFLGGVFGG